MTGGGVLCLLYSDGASWPTFLAPYPITCSGRELFYHPPSSIVWHDAAGHILSSSFVLGTRRNADRNVVRTGASAVPIDFFVPGDPYRSLGDHPAATSIFSGAAERTSRLSAGHRQLTGATCSAGCWSARRSRCPIGLSPSHHLLAWACWWGASPASTAGAIDNVLMRALRDHDVACRSFYLLIALAGLLPPTLDPRRSPSC